MAVAAGAGAPRNSRIGARGGGAALCAGARRRVSYREARYRRLGCGLGTLDTGSGSGRRRLRRERIGCGAVGNPQRDRPRDPPYRLLACHLSAPSGANQYAVLSCCKVDAYPAGGLIGPADKYQDIKVRRGPAANALAMPGHDRRATTNGVMAGIELKPPALHKSLSRR